jgi:ubiquinone/menaquinone biosynthesis C-methylase UbiE
MTQNTGQDEITWGDYWKGFHPESEIRMWDFYGMRQWVLKYVPRFGKTLEAGCGLGRYNFYLSQLGIEMEGLDLHKPTIKRLLEWQKKHHLSCNFVAGNVTNLSYEDNSLSGYISLGVVEHFIEGPNKALKEAFRVLRPGGIAIITTPSVSFSVYYHDLIKKVKNIIKKIVRHRTATNKVFFQYWYKPQTLKKFVEGAGFSVINYSGADLLYSFYEILGESKITPGSFPVWFSNKFENSFISNIGAQSITVSVKVAKKMYCFLCGEYNASKESMWKYDVPICLKCESNELALYYRRKKRPQYDLPYLIKIPIDSTKIKKCHFCGESYETDHLFENYGFSKNVCKNCLKDNEINIILSNEYVKPIWRPRNIDIVSN